MFYIENMCCDRNGYVKTEYMVQENVEKEIWTNDRARNMDNKF
jgi:hypothetical protein